MVKTFKTEASNCIADMTASLLLHGQQCMPKGQFNPQRLCRPTCPTTEDSSSQSFKPIIHHQSDCAFFRSCPKSYVHIHGRQENHDAMLVVPCFRHNRKSDAIADEPSGRGRRTQYASTLQRSCADSQDLFDQVYQYTTNGHVCRRQNAPR